MLTGPRRISKTLSSKVRDEARFFRRWMKNPLRVGAVSPSGPALARLMARMTEPERDGPLIELGPGTGVFTQALIARGISPRRLVLVEYSPEFCQLLRQRFPGVTVVNGDAYALGESLPDIAAGSVASIVSGLPLMSRRPPARRELVERALDLLQPGAPLVQFSYAPKPPVPAAPGVFSVEKSRWIVNNLPPARVWIYRRDVN